MHKLQHLKLYLKCKKCASIFVFVHIHLNIYLTKKYILRHHFELLDALNHISTDISSISKITQLSQTQTVNNNLGVFLLYNIESLLQKTTGKPSGCIQYVLHRFSPVKVVLL